MIFCEIIDPEKKLAIAGPFLRKNVPTQATVRPSQDATFKRGRAGLGCDRCGVGPEPARGVGCVFRRIGNRFDAEPL